MVVSGNSAFTICSTEKSLSTKLNILSNEKSKIKERKASSHIHAPFSSFSIDKISPIATSPRAFLNAATMFSKLYSSSNKSAMRILNMPASKAFSSSFMPSISPKVVSPNDSLRFEINDLMKVLTSNSPPS